MVKFKNSRKIEFLYNKKKEYLESLISLNKNFFQNVNEYDEKKISDYFKSRDIIYNSLQKIDITFINISKNFNLVGDLSNLIQEIILQDKLISIKINHFMKKISKIIFKIKKHEKYLFSE